MTSFEKAERAPSLRDRHASFPRSISAHMTDDLDREMSGLALKAKMLEHKIVWNPLIAAPAGIDELQDAEMFEKDYIQNVRQRPYKSTAKRWLINGGGIGGVLFLPFGPVGLLCGLVAGLVLGLCLGLVADLVKLRKKHSIAEKQKVKIKHLMRWAEFHFGSSEDQLQLLFKVVMEYQALTAVGGFSKTARSHLKMLYKFLKREDVQHVLWTYLDYFFSHWRKMGPQEINMCSTVFEVCIQCCVHLQTKRPPIVVRMGEILLESPGVTQLFSQAEVLQRKQRERAVREGDWLMYADAGDITAQEVFRRHMAHVRASSLTPSSRPLTNQTGFSSAGEVPLVSNASLIAETASDSESSASVPERDADVMELVVSEMEASSEPEREVEIEEQQIPDKKEKVGKEVGKEEKEEKEGKEGKEEKVSKTLEPFILKTTISDHSLSTRSFQGPMCLVPSHVAFSRSREGQGNSSSMTGLGASQAELDPIDSKRRLKPDDISIEVQPPKPKKREKKETPTPREIELVTSAPVSSRGKRLFRSLSDLINFAPDLKHQTPIGQYEMEFLTKYEQHDNSSRDWECTVNKPTCQVYKLRGDTPVVLVKAYAQFEGLPVSVVSHFIRHIPTRGKWDKTFEDYRLIEKDVEKNEMIYCLMKAPWPVTNRDFLQWRLTAEDDKTGDVMIVMRSASHPDFPEKSGVVRAETIISGYAVRAINGNKNSTQLFLLAQTDVKGLIPKFVVNQGAQRAPIQWTDALRKACVDYTKKHGSKAPSYDSISPSL